MEIVGGVGPTIGKVWRIGVMRFNAKFANVALLLEALKEALAFAELKNVALNTMIDIAERQFKIDIRKKSGARQSSK